MEFKTISYNQRTLVKKLHFLYSNHEDGRLPDSLLEYLLGRKWLEYIDLLFAQPRSLTDSEKTESFQRIGM